jgi:hypothetical protein
MLHLRAEIKNTTRLQAMGRFKLISGSGQYKTMRFTAYCPEYCQPQTVIWNDIYKLVRI